MSQGHSPMRGSSMFDRPKALLLGLAALTAAALVAAGCGGSDLGQSLDLADLGRCPDPLVIQTDWLPGPEQGALYNLTAGEGTMDRATGRFRGPLSAEPDLTVEIRSGGTFLEGRTVLRTLVGDGQILLGMVDTDEAVANHRRLPTTAVVAPLDVSPRIVLWDPATYEIESWDDVEDTDAVLHHEHRARFVDYLVGADLLDDDQPDEGYDRSPGRFLRSGGNILQQGSATRDPYDLENVLVEWGQPVGSLLVHDAGYEVYQGPLAILDDRLSDDTRACLAAFVPLVQQSIVGYQRDPAVTNQLLVDVVRDLNVSWGTSWELTDDGVANAVVEMGSQRIVSNGGNGAIGDFDLGRIEDFIVLLDGQVETIDVVPGLKPEDLVTNEFIDPDIGL